MSYKKKTMIPVLGMVLILGYAAINIVSGDADEIKHPLPQSLSDLRAVKLVEIKDADGQVVLSGSFDSTGERNGEIERKAILTGTGIDADAKGEAEIEISKESDAFTEQELEVSVENLATLTAFKLFVDGQEVAVFNTDVRGDAEIEMSNEIKK